MPDDQPLLQVHVGTQPPTYWANIEDQQRQIADEAAPWLRDLRRPDVASLAISWAKHGIEPAWVGSDSTACAAALDPNMFSGQGATEFDRFLAGAALRGEPGLVVSTIGKSETDHVRNVFANTDDSVGITRFHMSITSAPLGSKPPIVLSSATEGADKDLGNRLLNRDDARWWLLDMGGYTEHAGDGSGTRTYSAVGELRSILETSVGEPVVARWDVPDGSEVRYLVPGDVDWNIVLDWLVAQALPEHCPSVIRRTRAARGPDPRLMTDTENALANELKTLRAQSQAAISELEKRLQDASADADTIREDLLYGSGKQLVTSLASVLRSAGIEVSDVDELLGKPANADLLCKIRGHARLVEVKSSSGAAPERLYDSLISHLREWPTLPGTQAVDGGALIVNHQRKMDPLERSSEPYGRPEFLAAQFEPVVSAWSIFDAWRHQDWHIIQGLLFPQFGVAPSEPASLQQPKRRWFARGRH